MHRSDGTVTRRDYRGFSYNVGHSTPAIGESVFSVMREEMVFDYFKFGSGKKDTSCQRID